VCTETQQFLGSESSGPLRRLCREERLAEFVEATILCGQSESIIGSHRLWAEEAPHAVLDSEFTSSQGGHDHWTVDLFELSTVRALWILKENHSLIRIGVANQDSAFRGMTGRRRHRIIHVHR
jgi:hypothetical protein